PNQGQEGLRLLPRIAAREVARHLAHVGMRDGQLELRAGRGMPLDEAAIIELGRRRPDPADEPDMHRDASLEIVPVSDANIRRPRRAAASLLACPEPAGND